jgi:hypothetical protein
MKCPNCGYYNLPAAQVCGQCQRPLNADNNDAERLYPPRARQRDLRAKVNANSLFVRRTRQASQEVGNQVSNQWLAARENARYLRQRVTPNLREFTKLTFWIYLWRIWGPPLLSLVAGLGQLVQRHFLRGTLFLATYLLLLAFTISAFHTRIMVMGNEFRPTFTYTGWWQLAICPILLFITVWAAMVDAARDSIPPAPRESPNSVMRLIRIGLACAAVAGFVYSIIFSLLGTR